jgi:copper homeostasis protein (lipoprotein)
LKTGGVGRLKNWTGLQMVICLTNKTKLMELKVMAIGALFLIASCNNKSMTKKTEILSKTEAPGRDTSEHALDWAGTYTGTLPCADCGGIAATVTLNSNQTFQRIFVYHGKRNTAFDEKGKFTWNKKGDTITLDSKEDPSFRVKAGRIVMLDDDGNEVTGPLAEKYILQKN